MPRHRHRHTHTRATGNGAGRCGAPCRATVISRAAVTGRAAAALVLTALAAVACSSGGGGRDASAGPTAIGRAVASTKTAGRSAAPSRTGAVSQLYVVRGTPGTTARDGERWALTLAVPDGDVLAFDDRPRRGAHHITVAELADSWDRFGFADDPPNAALSGTSSKGTPIDVAVELADPHWDPATHTFAVSARTIGTDADTELPPALAEGSLFIDDAQQTIAINVINLASDPLVVSSATSSLDQWSGRRPRRSAGTSGPRRPTGPRWA